MTETQAGTTYTIKRKSGRCANGYELDRGHVFHAVPLYGWEALCGTSPGRRADWSMYPGEEVTCPRCIKKLAAVTTVHP